MRHAQERISQKEEKEEEEGGGRKGRRGLISTLFVLPFNEKLRRRKQKPSQSLSLSHNKSIPFEGMDKLRRGEKYYG